MKTQFKVTVRDFDPAKDLPNKKVNLKLQNPLHHVKTANIVEENGWFWLYVQGIHNYGYETSMDNYVGSFKTVKAAKSHFSKNESYKGIWI